MLPQNCGRSTAPAVNSLARTHAQSNTRAFTDPHIHVSTKDSYTNSQSRESHTATDGGHFYLQITAPLETNQAWCSTTRPAHKWFPVTLVTATKMSSSAGVADRVPTTTLACKVRTASHFLFASTLLSAPFFFLFYVWAWVAMKESLSV